MNKFKLSQLLFYIKLALWVAWPTTVYAAQMTLSEKFTDFQRGTFFIVFLLSTLSGLTSFVNSIKKKYDAKAQPEHLKLVFVTNLLGSNLMGLVAFLYTDANNYTVNTQAIAIILGAFGGVWLLEKVVDRAFNRVFPENEVEESRKVNTSEQNGLNKE